jgi:hypothetical protein
MVVGDRFPKFAELVPEYGPSIEAAAAKHIEVVIHEVGHSSSIWRQGVIRDDTLVWKKIKSGMCPEAKISKTDGPLKEWEGGLERWQHKRKLVGDG